MATLFPIAGAKIYIGSATMESGDDDLEASDFSGKTWKLIDGWTSMGAFGDAAEVISTNLINRNRTVKQKGTRDAGSMQNTFAALTSDEGQIAVIAADKTNAEYPFRIVWDDKPPVTAPTTSTPTTQYFIALVNGARYAGGDANAVFSLETTFEINSNIVTVARATSA